MKFSTLAFIASTAIAAETVNLQVVSDNGDLNGKGIQWLHEGAGFAYFKVIDQLGQEFQYDADHKLLYQPEQQYPANVGEMFDFLAVGISVTPSNVTFNEKGELDIGKQIYACKNVNDPYHYFDSSYGLLLDAPNESCVKVALKKIGGTQSQSPSPKPSASITHGWNTTVTDDVTVTGYTTYCPIPTTITITTCVQQTCGPKTITVDEPKTVTVTEECIIPSTTPVKPTSSGVTSAPQPTTPTTIAAPSTSSKASLAVVSSYEGGAAKNAAGIAAGVAGVAAMLI
uniref:Uncharacterized protein n=1 Tax=Candidozyma auris TaxID=498019 RepID=A0A0L0NYV1_CANAR